MTTIRLPALAILTISLLAAVGGLRAQPPAGPDVVFALKGHTDTVEAVAVSPDGTLIGTASFDHTAKLWDAATGKELRTFGGDQGHKGQVLAVAFSADGGQLATGGADNFARVWDTGTGFPAQRFAIVTAIAGPHAGLRCVGEFLPPQEQLARRLSFAPAAPVKNFQHPNLVDCVAFDDTGNLLATGCHDGILRIWDIAKGMPVKTINAHVQTTPQQVQNPIYAVVWAADHKQVFTASYDKTVKLWDVTTGKLAREFKAAPEPKGIAPKKEESKKDDKKDDAGTGFFGGFFPKEEPKKEEPPWPPGHRDQVFTIALYDDGKLLATGSSDRTVKLWKVASGKVVRDFENPDYKPVLPGEPAPSHPGWVQGVRFTPDGKFLVSAGSAPQGKSYIAVWNVADGTRVYGAERDFGPIHSLAVSKDGMRLIIGCATAKGQAGPAALVVKLPER
jgi:WD40 repeat protein